MKKITSFIALSLMFVFFNLRLEANEGHEHEEKQEKSSSVSAPYTCPMHPEVRQAQPGKCPQCGMKLEQKDSQDEMKQEANTY